MVVRIGYAIVAGGLLVITSGVAAQAPPPRARAPVASETLAVQVLLDRAGFSTISSGTSVRKSMDAAVGQ